MIAEAGAAAGAVHGHLVVAEEQPAVPELAKDPPQRLDVLVIIGIVAILIDPVGDAAGEGFPLLDVLPDALAAQAIKLGNAELFDIGFAIEAKFFFNLDLNRQAVGVPTFTATDDAMALHGPVAEDHILKRAANDMVQTRTTIGRRRAFIEDKRPLAAGEGAFNDPIGMPPGQDLFLQPGKGNIRSDRFEHDDLLGSMPGRPWPGKAEALLAPMLRPNKKHPVPGRGRGARATPRYHPSSMPPWLDDVYTRQSRAHAQRPGDHRAQGASDNALSR